MSKTADRSDISRTSCMSKVEAQNPYTTQTPTTPTNPSNPPHSSHRRSPPRGRGLFCE